MLAASGFSLVSLWFQAEKGTLSPLECLSFANTIQADLPTCVTGIPRLARFWWQEENRVR